ncbi:ADP-ribosyltransferase [Nocardia sp. NPDC058640]|uniref:ADP-ribosyltransferase n=1 Tax=Nocardia sp. NPDC058640 TaxID=3346571 RepID=UPI003654059C
MTYTGGSSGVFDDFPFAAEVLAGQSIDRLTTAERDAVEAYALNGFQRINTALRSPGPISQALERLIVDIRTGLARYPLPETVRVTREVDSFVLGIAGGNSAEDIVGDYFTELGFLSTSGKTRPPHSQQHIDPVILELLVPAGTPALRLGELSTVPDEKEILLIDARTYFAIHAAPDERSKLWRIEAIVVEEEQ